MYITLSESTDLTYYQKNRNVVLNRAKDYYENNKDRLREQAKKNIGTYLKKIRIKKENMEKNRYRNMSEKKKQKLKEYQKIIVWQKILNIIMNKIAF